MQNDKVNEATIMDIVKHKCNDYACRIETVLIEAKQKILENRNKIILSNKCETNVKRQFVHAGLFQSLHWHTSRHGHFSELLLPGQVRSVGHPYCPLYSKGTLEIGLSDLSQG